jgi:hypothetical protein
MDVIARMPASKPAAQAAFNRVRIYFGVTYLSEIVTAKGSSIARDAWEGGRMRLPPFLWPYQIRPGPKSFRHWQRILADAFLLGTRRRVSSRTRDLTLRTNVGPWLPASDAFRTHWDAFFSGEQNALFMVTNEGRFAKHPALKTNRRPKHPVKAFADQSKANFAVLPPDAVPAKHHHEPNKLVIPFSVATLATVPPQPPPATRWPNYLTSLPYWELMLLQHATFVNKPGLLEALRVARHLFLASDGGAADSKGSFGTVVANADTIFLECGGRAYGADPRSFRSKGYGILAILRLLFHVWYFYWTRNRTLRFTLLCDSKSLIDRLEASRALTRLAPRRYLFSEADVELQILSAMPSLGTVALEHVLGHQDDNDDGEPLSWEAQLIQQCDTLATDHLSSATDILPLVPFLPASNVGLTVQGTMLTHHLPTQLRTFAGLPEYREYLCRHHGWEPKVFDLIDWPIFHASTLTLSFLKRLFVIKWINDLLPFQEQQHKFHQSPSPQCPLSCGEHENGVHFLRCPRPAQLIVWKAYQTTLTQTFETWSLDPSLRWLVLSWLARLTDSLAIPLDNLPD